MYFAPNLLLEKTPLTDIVAKPEQVDPMPSPIDQGIKLSPADIEKVLYLSGMTDAGRFEAIIANTDTAGLLAMFGISYAELKEVLAMPDDRLTTTPEKDAQLGPDKAIADAPEYLSPYRPLPEITIFTYVENDLPISSDAESQAEYSEQDNAFLAAPSLDDGHAADLQPEPVDASAVTDAAMTPPLATSDMADPATPAPLLPAPENSDVQGTLPDVPCNADLGEITPGPAVPADLLPDQGASLPLSLAEMKTVLAFFGMSDAATAGTLEAFANEADNDAFSTWLVGEFLARHPSNPALLADLSSGQNDDSLPVAGGALPIIDPPPESMPNPVPEPVPVVPDPVPPAPEQVPGINGASGMPADNPGSDSEAGSDNHGSGDDEAHQSDNATNDAVPTPIGAEADAQNSGGDLHDGTAQNQNDDDSPLVSSELLLADPPGPGSTPPAEPPVVPPVVPPVAPPVVPPVVPSTEPVVPVTEPVVPVTEPVVPVTEPVVPVTEPVVPVTEPVVPVTEPVVPVTEPVVPVTEPVVPVTEPVLPPSLPVSQVPQQFPPVPDQLPGSNEGGSAQNGGSNGGEIDAGQGDTGQAGGTDGGSGVAGGTEAGLKPEPGAGAKGSSISSSITTGSAGVDLSASGLGVGSESMGVVLGVATGSVVHSISSGDFGFSFGSGSGGGGGGRNHQDERDSHNEAGGPGITPLPPLIHIGPPLPDNNVNEVVNSPPALPPLPPVELPGPGDMDDIIIDAVIDAVNQHAGDGPADGGDSGDEQGNAPAPVPPQASGNANVNGAHAFIAHAREAIVHMQAATAAALGLVYTVEARYNEARQGFEAAEEAFEEFHTMADNGVVLDDFDYANLDLAEAQMARWTAIMNDSDSFLDYQHVFVNQQTAGINIMRALIAQAQAQLAGWDAQAGIADANANPDNAGGDAVGDGAANGGHAGAIGADPNAGALPGGGGNAGQDPAGDQPDQAPAPVDEPDADLPPNIVIANEVIAQGNALIAAMHARVALREAAIVQNETLIANTQHNITWLQDTIVAGQHMIDYNGIVTSRQNLINWWRELITNTQALISEAQADLNRALQDMIEVQGQIAQARAEVDAWFHRDAVAGVQGALPGVDVVDADAIVHQEDAPGPARVTGAALPPEQGDVDASPVVFDGDADYSAVPVPVPPPAPYVPVLIPLPDPGPAPVIIDPNAIDPVLDQEALDDDAGMDAGHENNSDGETGSDDDGIEVDDPPPFEMDDNDHAAMDGAPLVPPPVPQDLPEIHQDALDDFIQDGVIDAVINHAPEDNPANDANPEHLEPDVDAGSAPGDDAVSEAPSDPDQDSDDNADDASDAEGNDDDAGDGQGGGDDEDGNTDGGNGADDDGGADDGGADDGGADDGGADDGGADDGGADDGGADGGSGADDGTDEDGDEAMPPPPPNNNAGGDPVLPPVVPVPAHIAELGTILTNVNGAQARIDHAQAAINQMQAEIDAGELALEATIGMIVDEQDNIAEQVAAIAHMHDLLNQGLVANEQAAATISIAQAAIANARITINDVATASDDLRAMIGAGQEAIAHWHAVIAEALAEIAALQAQVQAANADDLPPDDGGPDGGADDPGEAGDAGDAGFEDGNDGDDAGLHDDGNAPADEAIPPANQGGNVLAGADLLPVQNGLVAAPVPPAALPDNLTSAQAHIAHAEAVIAQLQAEMHAAGLAIEAAVNLLGEQQAIVTNEEETAAHMHYLINEGLANADEPDAISHDIANVEDAEAAISIAESNIADAMTAMNDVERIIQDNRAFIEATQTVIEHWQAVIAQALEEIAAGPGQAVDVHETAGAPDDDPDDEPDAGSGSGSGTGTGAGAPSDAGTAEDEHVHAGMQADPDALASAGHGSHGSVNDADSAPVTAGSGIDPGTLARRSQWLIVELDSTPGHAASSHGLPDAGGIAQNLPMIRAVIENWSRSMPSSVSVELAGFDFFDAQAGAPASLAIELTMRSAGPSGAAGLLAPDAVLLLKSSIQAYLASGEPVQGSAPAVVDTGVAEPIAEIATVATVAASEPDILTLDNTGMATMTVALFPEDTLQVFGNVAADVAGPPSTIDGNWDIVIIAAPEIALIW